MERFTLEASRVGLVRRGVAQKLGVASAVSLGLGVAAPLVAWIAYASQAVFGGLVDVAMIFITAGFGLGVAAFLASMSFASARAVPLRLAIDGGDLDVFDGDKLLRRVPLATIREGLVVPTKAGARVDLVLDGGDVLAIDVANLAAGDALLHAAHLGASAQRCHIELVDPAASVAFAFVALLLTAYMTMATLPLFILIFEPILHGSREAVALFSLIALASLAFAIRRTRPPAVTIGADGLSWKQGLRDRFIPFDELVRVEPAGLQLKLTFKGGRVERLHSMVGFKPSRFEALHYRIASALEARRSKAAPPIALLDRRGRSIAEWRAALAGIASHQGGYRRASLDEDDLRAVLDDPSAPAERRVGAAIALGAIDTHPADEHAPLARLRIAAEQSASPRARIVLASAADAIEAAALAEVEATPAAKDAMLEAALALDEGPEGN